MQTLAKKYLTFIDASKLARWSVQGLCDTVVSYSHGLSLCRIGDFLIRNKCMITLDKATLYKRVTVRINNNGVSLRDTQMGMNIGTKKQYLAKTGQFIVSKIDARKGAFGIIPEELNHAIVTNDFPLFDVDTSLINPRFLLLITTTEPFIGFVQSCSRGTTNRQRMDMDLFLAQKIPLPSITQQEIIVSNYYSKIEKAQSLSLQAVVLERDVQEFIPAILSCRSNDLTAYTSTGLLKFVDFSSLDVWGVEKNSSARVVLNTAYKTLPIRDLCDVGSGGTPSRNKREFYNGRIPWIKTAEVLNAVIYDTAEKITPEAIDNSTAKIFPKGSLIIAMYGQGLTRGRTAKLGIDASTNQACAVLYNIKTDLILTDFLWIYLIGEYHRLRALASGNNQPNLNAHMIKEYQVVIPSFALQKQIIANYKNLKEEINQLLIHAEQLRAQAVDEFEKNIFR